MFSTLHKTNFKSSVTFILSYANTFNLDKPKILSFRNELNKNKKNSPYPFNFHFSLYKVQFTGVFEANTPKIDSI